jgi:hypothetical protein
LEVGERHVRDAAPSESRQQTCGRSLHDRSSWPRSDRGGVVW